MTSSPIPAPTGRQEPEHGLLDVSEPSPSDSLELELKPGIANASRGAPSLAVETISINTNAHSIRTGDESFTDYTLIDDASSRRSVQHSTVSSDLKTQGSTKSQTSPKHHQLQQQHHQAQAQPTSPPQQQQQQQPEISPLVSASQLGDFRKVNQLITSGEASALETAPDGVTPLHWAAINNRLNICRYLLDHGAQIDAKGGDLQGTPLHWACRAGLVYIVQLLISRGADPLRTDTQGFNALHLAVHSSNVLLVIYLLHLDMPVDPLDTGDRTPLHWAAYQGDALTVDALLKKGADVRISDSRGFTALHWAIVRGSKPTIKKIIEAGSDLFAKSNDGKTPLVMAQGMNTLNVWKAALKETGRDPETAMPIVKLLQPKHAKLAFFFAPYIILFIALNLWASLAIYWSIPLSIVITLAIFKLLGKFVLPSISTEPHALMQTPIFAGLFSGSAFWVVIHYIFDVMPVTFTYYVFRNLLFIVTFSLVIYSFFESMFRDPGFIPPISNPAEQRAMIDGLIERGEYDTKHFCISTYVRKPLRSRYDRFTKHVVAKFDHYCPWTYNVIGVRNHRIFVVFVITLTIGIPMYLSLYFKYTGILSSSTVIDYCKENPGILGSTFCRSFQVDYYGTLLAIWTTFNGVWVFFLAFVQIVQVARGVTTNEASNLHKYGFMGADDFSSLPLDHSTAINTALANSAAAVQAQARMRNNNNSRFSTCLKLLGIDQFLATARDAVPLSSGNGRNSSTRYSSNNNPADLGCFRNCADFWFPRGSFNVLRALPDGAASFAGNPVDYYRMWDFPTRNGGASNGASGNGNGLGNGAPGSGSRANSLLLGGGASGDAGGANHDDGRDDLGKKRNDDELVAQQV
ncbi:uncharacterized protein SAPINGB_P001663 [Magnusiomyces paraingens]|uniref:Palmitoyltransferase n=1 Tax=Magnusiomyces paraingens TaxID=2606893 RepID=A0A5E8BCY6_9ASCO|nr:uncharacterized protein SAPINGB_P001663 [Saprochaete ingens]VVT47341.1 unnamed protein product [Saprochaete ingens]